MNRELEYYCISHVGMVRSINQDNYICNGIYNKHPIIANYSYLHGVCTPSNVLFGVFDGMGGEEYGEIASRIAAECAQRFSICNPLEDLNDLCLLTNEKICRYVASNGLSSMGTTAAYVYFCDSQMYICNIGDTAIYRFHNGILEKISMDHIQYVKGFSKPLLSQNLGIIPSDFLIQPYCGVQENVQENDIYIICSDGLTDMLSEHDIVKEINTVAFCVLAKNLLAKALDYGGLDNITVLICKT